MNLDCHRYSKPANRIHLNNVNTSFPPVRASVLALIRVVLPAGQGCSSTLVLCCTAVVLLKPAVWAVLRGKSINTLILGLPIAPLVQLLHEHILPQDGSVPLRASLQRSHASREPHDRRAITRPWKRLMSVNVLSKVHYSRRLLAENLCWAQVKKQS